MDWQQNDSITLTNTAHLLQGWRGFTAHVQGGRERGDKRILWVEGTFYSNVTILNYKLKSSIKNHKTISDQLMQSYGAHSRQVKERKRWMTDKKEDEEERRAQEP